MEKIKRARLSRLALLMGMGAFLVGAYIYYSEKTSEVKLRERYNSLDSTYQVKLDSLNNWYWTELGKK